jgi:hypothetical protein
MPIDMELRGAVSGTGADVNASRQLKIVPETDAAANPGNVGAVRVFGENDAGDLTGIVELRSQEIDEDYRGRVALDFVYDEEDFAYTAQNTGKHSYLNTTMTNTWTAGQVTTNATSITTTTTGTVFQTYAFFPVAASQGLSISVPVGFSAQPQANTFIEFGPMIPGAQTVAPTDGVFLRLSAAGLQGIASFNGSETSTGVFPLAAGAGTWVYVNSKRYNFTVDYFATHADFWVDDGSDSGALKLGSIPLPAGLSRLAMSAALPFAFKHRITGGAAGGVIQATFGAYTVRTLGANISTTASTHGNRLLGSYQGLSGGTLGTLARVGTITTGNEANVTAAVPTTTTAALGSGLGGTFWETVTLALNTDGIIMSYQVPAGTVNVQGRRLVLRGMYLTSYVQTVIVGGPYIAEWFLAFGHTAVSLATTEAAATKAPRRIALPFTQVVTAAQAVSTVIAQQENFVDFGDAPVFVNPGEFVQLCTRHIGTVGTSGTVVHRVTPIYGWE